MPRVQPAHLLLALLGIALISAPAAAGYRFHALLDGDRDIATGCPLQTAAGTLQGGEMRVTAHTDRSRVIEVTFDRCVEGAWQQVTRHPSDLGIGHNAGANGGDLIRWSLPAEHLRAYSAFTVRVAAEHEESAASDVLAEPEMQLALGLAGQPEPHTIPSTTLIGLGALGLAVGLLAAWRLRGQARLGLGALVLGAWMLNPMPHPSAVPGAWAQAVDARPLGSAASSIVRFTAVDTATPHAQPGDSKAGEDAAGFMARDVAHDQTGTDPGVDLLHAQLNADVAGMQILVEVRDIEFAALADGARVLLLGNSLTSSNRLPEILQAVARQAGRTLVTASVTRGGVNLDDLYRDGEALREIERGRYQLVIMQQGPSSLPASQEDLLLGAMQFNAPIRASGARPALYMVWPDVTRRGFFDDVRDAYSNAALAIDGMFIPAGEAWRAAWRRDPALPLYASDQFHPSELGSYAAALSMFAALYGQSPVGLPATLTLASGRSLRFDPDDALIVQQAAWEAHLQSGRPGH